MPETKILCGIHCLKERAADRYYPVAVYLATNGNYTDRETCLIKDEVEDTREGIFDLIDEHLTFCKNDDDGWDWPHFVGDFDTSKIPGSLDGLRLYHPTKNRIGETISGTVAGWHVDYRTNYSKSYSPVIIGNLCFHDGEGRVNFVTVAKHEIEPHNEEHLRFAMAKAFEQLSEQFKLGGEVIIDIVPAGKDRARFSQREYIAPPTFEETVLDAIRQATNPSVG